LNQNQKQDDNVDDISYTKQDKDDSKQDLVDNHVFRKAADNILNDQSFKAQPKDVD